jgi:predicted flap endonuclease-1-like 5' DNA nuclease
MIDLPFAASAPSLGTIAAAVGVGGAVLWALRRWIKARSARWENRVLGLESQVALARLDRTRALEESRGRATEVARLSQTIAKLRAEADQLRTSGSEADRLRAAAADADYSRDLARRRALNLAAELDHTRSRLAKLPAALQRAELADRDLELAREEEARQRYRAEALEQQVTQARAAAHQEREYLDATQRVLGGQIRERERQLETIRVEADQLLRQRQELDREIEALTRRLAESESAARAATLAHHHEAARLAAEIGSLTARLDRLEPLRGQLADREVLIRTLATERDAATRLLANREAEVAAISARLLATTAEQSRLEGIAARREAAQAELERRLAAVSRERDALATAGRQAEARIAGLTAELRDRDTRFRVLLADRKATVEASEAQLIWLRAQLSQVADGRLEPANGDSHDDLERISGHDDLKRISGIGPSLERLLEEQGVRTFKQIASWTEADIEEISRRLGPFKTRIRRDRWVEQARLQLEKEYGEHLDQ